jgi:hypothetical protein
VPALPNAVGVLKLISKRFKRISKVAGAIMERVSKAAISYVNKFPKVAAKSKIKSAYNYPH